MYRDIWFDKPPLYALVYTLAGAATGWPLRLFGASFVCISCWIAWHCIRRQVDERAGLLAAALLATYLTFEIPSAVIALAPDLLTLPLNLAALCLAFRGRAFWSGVCAGVALLFNGKALFIAAACLLWASPIPFLSGFALPNLALAIFLMLTGSLDAYWKQVWVWGARYSAETFVVHPVREGFLRTANWIGFHATIVAGSIVWLRRRFSWRYLALVIISFAAVCAGLRFFPRYYFHVLPVILLMGVRGLMLLTPKCRLLLLCLTIIPILRFGPRYVQLASGDRSWSDLALMNDSRAAASIVREVAQRGDRMLVWGYRPDIFVWSALPAATPYLDSQPLNGVFADRHLTESQPSATDLVRGNFLRIKRRPEIIVDGLGILNPELAVTQYPELAISGYRLVGKTKFARVYVTKR